MSGNDDLDGPMKARSDLVDMLKASPENAAAIVTLIRNELQVIQDSDAVSSVSGTIDSVAADSGTSSKVKENVLYWLTQTSLDARQMIMVRTIEELLGIEECKPATLDALAQISSKDNVEMVMEWVNRSIMTLNQAVYVLLFPDSSDALK
ncbi:MAG: hypothetical protein KAQ65_00680 [Candidatus Thorarchaeota archaeon]|nr:hypothetical protein [Candidatus Thorarchaeota archaeon]